MDYSHCQNNWSCEVKDIMSKIELNDFFINRQPVDLVTAKQSVTENYNTDWTAEVSQDLELQTLISSKVTIKGHTSCT